MGHYWIEVRWREDYVEMLEEIWPALVGNGTNLTAKISGKNASPSVMKMGSPGDIIRFDNFLYSGSCYEVLLYTATPSGIVSENRTEFHVRTEPPQAKITLREVGEKSANLLVTLFDEKRKNGVTKSQGQEEVVTKIDEDCVLVFLAKNNNGTVVGNRTHLSLNSGLGSQISVGLGSLKPYSKYHCTAFIRCGVFNSDFDLCQSAEVPLSPFSFETAQGRPGPVARLRLTTDSPYAARIKWEVPERPNGIISSYLVIVIPEIVSR